jgi:hypothetical protein
MRDINPNEYIWTPERVAVLREYERRVERFNNAESMVRKDRSGKIAASDVYHALRSVTIYREVHGITRREMTAFKSRKAVKCSTVAQAITALTGMFAKKSERAA